MSDEVEKLSRKRRRLLIFMAIAFAIWQLAGLEMFSDLAGVDRRLTSFASLIALGDAADCRSCFPRVAFLQDRRECRCTACSCGRCRRPNACLCQAGRPRCLTTLTCRQRSSTTGRQQVSRKQILRPRFQSAARPSIRLRMVSSSRQLCWHSGLRGCSIAGSKIYSVCETSTRCRLQALHQLR